MKKSVVRKKRLSKGLSQAALAQQIGISTLTIINIENGKANPNLSTMKVVAEALNSTLEDLFG